MNFHHARQHHRSVADAAQADIGRAGDLWNAVADIGEPAAGSVAEAVRDTLPDDHAMLLASSDVAAAYAFQIHWEAVRWDSPSQQSTGVKLRDRARQAWATFGERASLTEDLALGFGWDLQSAWANLSDVDIRSGNMAAVERIARMAGRMYAALKGARASRVHGVPEEVHSVEQGNNIARLLPTELAQLADPDLELPVLMRIVEKTALQYEVRGTGQRSKGPLVMALDESDSMHDVRREWSKAAAIALMRVAFDEKRPVSVVHFSTSCVVRRLRPGDADGVMAMIRHFLHGGTDIGFALRQCVEQVKLLAAKGDKGADIVLVTDGVEYDEAAHVAALDEADKLGARLWTVAIECDIHPEQALRARAAQYIHLDGSHLRDAASVVQLGKAAA